MADGMIRHVQLCLHGVQLRLAGHSHSVQEVLTKSRRVIRRHRAQMPRAWRRNAHGTQIKTPAVAGSLQHVFRLAGQHSGRHKTARAAHQGGGSGNSHIAKLVSLVVAAARGQDNGLQRPGLRLTDMDLILLQPGIARLKTVRQKSFVHQFPNPHRWPGRDLSLGQQGILMPVHILPRGLGHHKHMVSHKTLLCGRQTRVPPGYEIRQHDDQQDQCANGAQDIHLSTSVTLTREPSGIKPGTGTGVPCAGAGTRRPELACPSAKLP